jgi:hypothetical protein
MRDSTLNDRTALFNPFACAIIVKLPFLMPGGRRNVALPSGFATTIPTTFDPITLVPLRIRSTVAPGVAVTMNDG